MIGSRRRHRTLNILAQALVGAFLSCAPLAAASAQLLTVTRQWRFLAAPPTTAGDVNICRNNAPVGRFFGRQPVLTALADVDEALLGISSCSTTVIASALFTVGPLPTLVEFECTLNGDFAVGVPGGTGSVGAIGLINGQPLIDCGPQVAQVIGPAARAIATTDRIRVCLEPGEHRASGELDVGATAPRNFFFNRRAVSNFEIPRVPNPGLPHGLMLILQSRGQCDGDEVGFRFGDVDGDGYFSVGDFELVRAYVQAPTIDGSPNPRMVLADVAEPCAGIPDAADLAHLSVMLTRRLTAPHPTPIRSACTPRPAQPPHP